MSKNDDEYCDHYYDSYCPRCGLAADTDEGVEDDTSK